MGRVVAGALGATAVAVLGDTAVAVRMGRHFDDRIRGVRQAGHRGGVSGVGCSALTVDGDLFSDEA